MCIKILQKKIRFQIRMLRNSMTLNQRQNESQKILKIAFNYNIFYESKNIACFLPFDGEINICSLILKLWLHKKNIFLPIVKSISSKKILFVKFTPESILYYNKYNILEPYYKFKDIISETDLDLIIVPLVAFDFQGMRIGMGGGFYDKILKNWKTKKFIPMGIAYDFQLVNYIPKQSWDIPLPFVLTPSKMYFFY